MTCALAYGIGLATVLRNVGVDEADDVRTDRSFHDIGKWHRRRGIGGHVAFESLNGDQRASGGGGHFGASECGETRVFTL